MLEFIPFTSNSFYLSHPENSIIVFRLEDLCSKVVLQPVTLSRKNHFRASLIPKATKSWWLVIDVMFQNKFTMELKMECMKSVITILQANNLLTTIYFRDAYLHMPVLWTSWQLPQSRGVESWSRDLLTHCLQMGDSKYR